MTRTELHADCARCFGLCCVALPFARSADFAVDKPAGTPCTNLQEDFRCGIHGALRERGFAGCTVFDCFGAGQKVSQVTFGGQDWRRAPGTARRADGRDGKVGLATGRGRRIGGAGRFWSKEETAGGHA